MDQIKIGGFHKRATKRKESDTGTTGRKAECVWQNSISMGNWN